MTKWLFLAAIVFMLLAVETSKPVFKSLVEMCQQVIDSGAEPTVEWCKVQKQSQEGKR